jgi:hypothetical protein
MFLGGGASWPSRGETHPPASKKEVAAIRMPKRLERGRTGLVGQFKELPLSRFTVKIRTPSLL